MTDIYNIDRNSLHKSCVIEVELKPSANYFPPIGSCDYDEHEHNMYFIGDSEENNND